jgi:uncharacterized repeat protein (TIGR03803 family)
LRLNRYSKNHAIAFRDIREEVLMRPNGRLETPSTALLVVSTISLVLAPVSCGQSNYSSLYKFKGGNDGTEPLAGLTFDRAGNLYRTTTPGGASDAGTVFGLTPNSNGNWTETVLYDFCC